MNTAIRHWFILLLVSKLIHLKLFNMRLKYSVFLAFTLIVACSQQENNNKITYEPDKKTLEIDISKSITSNETFLEKIKITKILFLNGEDENFVTSARKIIEKNSLLYILDYKSKKLSSGSSLLSVIPHRTKYQRVLIHQALILSISSLTRAHR